MTDRQFARTGKGWRIHRLNCVMIRPPDDPIRQTYPHAYTLPVPLTRQEALAFLAGSPKRHRCLVCAPDVPEVE